MAQWLNWGDGSDGSPNAISGTINTYATCTGTAGQTVLTTDLAASAGDQILIHQTRHATAAGTWEIVKVVSDEGATLNLSTALVNSYSTGAQCVLIPQYTGGTISGAVTGTAWNGTTGGIIALMSNGDLTISGSITAPAGYKGGQSGPSGGGNQVGFRGEGYTANPQDRSTAANTSGGGGGGCDGDNKGGGGGGGHAASGSTASGSFPGTGGGSCGLAALTSLFFGGGGGSGASDNNSASGVGGAGGGIVLIIAKNITVSGTINGNGGAAGFPTGNAAAGGSGGSGGGSVLIKCQTAVLGTNKITGSAGAYSTSSYGSPAGGAGSVGRIRCDYFTSVSGTTTPTLSSAQDTTLNVAGGSGFFAFF